MNEESINEHLHVYSKTLVSYISEIKSIVNPEYCHLLDDNIYICPLCLKNYFIKTDAGIIKSSEFSLDHLPPKSTGGAYKIITCKKCNNDSGTFEAELEKVLNFAVDKTQNDTGLSFKVNVNDPETGKSIRGSAYNKDGKTEILFDENLKKYRKDYADFLNNIHSNKKENYESKSLCMIKEK